MQHVLERFKPRQIRLGACQPLRAASARDAARPAAGGELAHEFFDERRLSDAWLTGYAQQQPARVGRLVERVAQFGVLRFSADDMALLTRRRPSGARPVVRSGDAGARGLDLRSGRPEALVLLEHLQNQAFERPRNVRITGRKRLRRRRENLVQYADV